MGGIATIAAYELPPELVELRAGLREIVHERIAPRAAEIDAAGDYPWDVREVLAAHDLLGLAVAVQPGGIGSTLTLGVAIEEIAKTCASSAAMLVLQDLGTLPVRLFGTERQKRAWLPRCASGEWAPAFALSDPDARGPAAMRVTARRDDGEWVLDGPKTRVANAGIADFYVVFATTRGEHEASVGFVVEADRPGLSVLGYEALPGLRGSPTGTLLLEHVRVPDEHRISDVDGGVDVARAALERGRLSAAALAVGIAQGALEHATRQAAGRRAADRLAGLAARIAAARELLYRACLMADRADAALAAYSAMARLFASEVAMQVTAVVAPGLGGAGGQPLERMRRDAVVARDGSDSMDSAMIARVLAARR